MSNPNYYPPGNDMNPYPPSQTLRLDYDTDTLPPVQSYDAYDNTIFPHAEFEAGVQQRLHTENPGLEMRTIHSALGAGWGSPETQSYQPNMAVRQYSSGLHTPIPHTAPLLPVDNHSRSIRSPTLPPSIPNSAPIRALLTSASPSPPPAISQSASLDPGFDEVSTAGPRPRTTYTAEEYLALVGAVVDVKPYAAPSRQIGKRWKLVAKQLKEKGHFANSGVDTIKNKMKAILDYHEDSNTPAGKKLEQVIHSNERVRVQISALIDQVAGNRDDVAKLDDDQREQKSVKEENNKKGGMSIRDASCQAHVSRKRQLAADTDSDSDSENIDPSKSSSSKPKAKRIKTKGDGSLAEIQEVRELITEGEKRREKFEEEIIGAMKTSTAAYERIGSTMIDVLREKLN